MIELEHVGIAVGDAASAIALMESILCEAPYKSESVPTEGVRTHFIRSGGAKLELLEALNSDSPIVKFLKNRGPGLHHLAFEVDDIHATRDRLLQAGFNVLDEEPRRGADGKVVFFVHPRDTGGVLFEFCRQDRSVLETTSVDIHGDRLTVQRAGSASNPPVLVLDSGVVDIECLARGLERSTYVLVVREEDARICSDLLESLRLDRLHIAATPRVFAKLGLPSERIRSSTMFVDAEADALPHDKNILIAAAVPYAGAAARLWSSMPDADLVVGDDELIARAVEKHIQRVEAR